MNENTIYLWSDGTWRYSEDFSEICDAWKGEDYSVIDMPEDFTYDEIDGWCWEHTKENFK